MSGFMDTYDTTQAVWRHVMFFSVVLLGLLLFIHLLVVGKQQGSCIVIQSESWNIGINMQLVLD